MQLLEFGKKKIRAAVPLFHLSPSAYPYYGGRYGQNTRKINKMPANLTKNVHKLKKVEANFVKCMQN